MKRLILLMIILMSVNASAISMDDAKAVTVPETASENISRADSEFSFYDAAQNIYDLQYTADFKGVLNKTLDMFFSEIRENLKLMAAVIMLGVICTLLSGLEIGGKSAVAEASFISCYAVLAGLTAAGFTEIARTATECVDDMALFVKSLVPVLTSMAIAEGKVISAPAVHTQVLAASAIAGFIIKSAVLPVIYASFAVKFINNMTSSMSLSGLSAFLDKICRRILSFILLIFTAMLALTNFAAGVVEGMGLKTARFALSSFVPAAGGALSDTVSSLAASATMIKCSVGTAGIIAIGLMSAYPVIKCAAMSFLYNLAGALIEPVADKRFASAVSSVGTCMGLLFAVVSVSAALYVISSAILLSAVRI